MKVKDVIADDIMRCKESIDEELQKSGYSHELYDQLNRLYVCVLNEEVSRKGSIEEQLRHAEDAIEWSRKRLDNAHREYVMAKEKWESERTSAYCLEKLISLLRARR